MKSSSGNLLNSQQGSYPLHLACEEGDIEKVKALLKKKYEISGYDDRHWTPLHCAANNRQLLICKHLLKLGASATAVTSNNATPLHYLARLIDHAELLTCLKLLIEKGADVNHLTYQQISPLHEASSRGSVVAASFLLDNGARIDQVNSFSLPSLFLFPFSPLLPPPSPFSSPSLSFILFNYSFVYFILFIFIIIFTMCYEEKELTNRTKGLGKRHCISLFGLFISFPHLYLDRSIE